MSSPRITTHWSRIESPFGPLLAAAGDDGLLALTFLAGAQAQAVAAQLALRLGTTMVEDPPALLGVAAQVAEYRAGDRRRFDLDLDPRLMPEGFGRRVLDATRQLPHGAVTTYADVAMRAGAPQGARAAGSALARNPLQLVIPCHRVVRSDGSPGGYAGGADCKAALLAHESQPHKRRSGRRHAGRMIEHHKPECHTARRSIAVPHDRS